MASGMFEVEVIDRDSGSKRWVTVQADNRDAAIQQVASLGEIVGDARLLSVASTSGSGTLDGPVSIMPNESGANAFSWLGFLFVPLAIVGIVWGSFLKEKTDGQKGKHAVTVGWWAIGLWIVFVPLLVKAFRSRFSF